MIVFASNVWNRSHVIKIAPTRHHEGSFLEKKHEKWEIFNFADFHLKTHISSFFQSTIETIIYIMVYIGTSILLPCQKFQINYPCTFLWPKYSKILPLPPSKLRKIWQNFIHFINYLDIQSQLYIYFIVSLNVCQKHFIQSSLKLIYM